MFEHSVKVPRHFKVAATIFKKVSTEGGSVKTLLYDDKLRHFKTNVLYALITETIKHGADIDKIFEQFNVLKTESRLDPWLAKVLTTELLFGKKTLPGKSKPEQTILSYKEKFESYVSEHQDDMKIEAKPRPRYVRVNTNLLTTSDAIRAFQDEGFRFIRCTSGSYQDYLEQIQKLTEYDFTQDYHVKTIFVFAPGTKWHDHELYLENKILLQDKATAMAVHLLAPPSGSTVLDMCAAPGMKTTQLAAYMRNEGKIYAVERNEKRYQTLCDFVEKTGCKCVETFNKDALAMQRGDYDDVEYILLDPSCSGSGMDFCVHNYIEPTRLAKLTSLQEKFLKHAMNAFPKAKRIVYSTCSLYPEENERVITNVVKTSRAKWRVQDVKELLKGQWNNFGSGMYGSMGTRCMYAKPDSDLTTGFFLAVLDRDEKDLAKASLKEINKQDVLESNEVNKVKNKKIKDKREAGVIEDDAIEVDEERSRKKKNKNKDSIFDEESREQKEKKKKREKFIENDDNDSQLNGKASELANNSELIIGEEIEEQQTEKRKKKRKKDTDNDDNDSQLNGNASELANNSELIIGEEIEEQQTEKRKKKRKKDIEIVNDNDGEVNRKASELANNSELIVKEEIEEQQTEKRKKKRKKDIEIVNDNDGEINEKASELANNSEDIFTEEIELEQTEKRKKKRKRDIENVENGDETNLEEDVRVSKKKKKKDKMFRCQK